jgi:hypothetical protein
VTGSTAWICRTDAIVVVVLLAGLPLLARRFLGPASDRRLVWLLRVTTSVAVLVLLPAKAAVERFAGTLPSRPGYLNTYHEILGSGPPGMQLVPVVIGETLFLVLMAGYVAIVLGMTTRRSPVVPGTLGIGTGTGLLLGLVMYAVAPLGLTHNASNPWLRGSQVDPLVALAWVLLTGGPVAAALAAGRRYRGPRGSEGKIRQGFAAGLLVNLTGALTSTVQATGTIALVPHVTALRAWLYRGHHVAGTAAARPVRNRPRYCRPAACGPIPRPARTSWSRWVLARQGVVSDRERRTARLLAFEPLEPERR